MQDLRIVLVIVGALAIAALVIHGLWTNRKNQRAPIKEKPLGRMAPATGSAPALKGDGFDEDGIGRVRTLSRNVEPKPKLKPESRPLGGTREPSLAGMPTIQALDLDPEDDIDDPLLGSTLGLHAEPEAKPEVRPAAPERRQADRRQPVIKSWQDVYVINVMARDGRQLLGPDLARGLQLLGFCFGDMSIYHRHLEMNGQGEVLFSLVNMVKPGTFDPDTLSRFSTPGVSLFMQLPPSGRAVAQFDLMVRAADKLAGEVNGLLMDQERRPLTELQLDQCRDELRAYDLH